GALCLAALAAPAGAAGGKAYASPQEVFDAAIKAAQKEDWRTFTNCLTNDSADTLAGGLALGAVLTKTFLSALAEKDETGKIKEILLIVDGVIKKHGLDKETPERIDLKDQAAVKKLLGEYKRRIKDRAGFVADMMAAQKKIPGGEKAAPYQGGAELKDLK